MKVSINLAPVVTQTRDARKALGQVQRALTRAAYRAAEGERAEHVFNNITGRLEASINGSAASEWDPNHAVVVLSAGMPYAGYVEGRNRMNMHGRANQTHLDFLEYVETMNGLIDGF